MSRRSKTRQKKDANQTAFALVALAVGPTEESGEDLLGSEDLKRQLREAKSRAKPVRKKTVKKS